MPTKSDGSPRYPHRDHRDHRPETLSGLGRPLLPADIYIEVKRLLVLDDGELLDAFAAGAAAVVEGAAQGALVDDLIDPEAAVAAATQVTRSRLRAWRQRARQMTWDELRIFLLGGRAVVLEAVDRPETSPHDR